MCPEKSKNMNIIQINIFTVAIIISSIIHMSAGLGSGEAHIFCLSGSGFVREHSAFFFSFKEKILSFEQGVDLPPPLIPFMDVPVTIRVSLRLP